MKYYFVKDTQGRRHIVVAKNEDNLAKILANASVYSKDLYELKEDTFDTDGFLISDK